jgi:hypothetical protein
MKTYKGMRVVDGVIMCECCDSNPVAVCALVGVRRVRFYVCVECDEFVRGDGDGFAGLFDSEPVAG